jgi:hypothetical protein
MLNFRLRMTSHIVADSTVVSDVLENIGIVVGIIFLAHIRAKIEVVRRNPLIGSTGVHEKTLAF